MVLTFPRGQHVLYLSAGVHSDEDLKSIVKRKQQEISEAGFALWGYGGSLGSPSGLLGSFIKASGGNIEVVMRTTTSKHSAVDHDPATHFAAPGHRYEPIPPAIKCIGSRWALVLASLEEVDEDWDLGTCTAHGGKREGDKGEALQNLGQADQLRLVVEDTGQASLPIRIALRAQLKEPFAVHLR